MANGIKTPFTVDAARAKEFLQQSANSKACENRMDKARMYIPNFDDKRVTRKEVSVWLAERQENGKA